MDTRTKLVYERTVADGKRLVAAQHPPDHTYREDPKYPGTCEVCDWCDPNGPKDKNGQNAWERMSVDLAALEAEFERVKDGKAVSPDEVECDITVVIVGGASSTSRQDRRGLFGLW